MTPHFFAGVLTAWTAAHLGLGLFFALAYLLGRREQEYLLFSALCAAFSVLTGGVAYDLTQPPLAGRLLADQITHAGATLAAVINVHFAASIASLKLPRGTLVLLYGAALLLLLGDIQGRLWVPGSHHLVQVHALGLVAKHAIADLTWMGILLYALGTLEAVAAVSLLGYAYAKGRREALGALAGAGLALPATLNDVALATGVLENTLTLLPHVFLLYAFGTAGTLLWRYRLTTGALEETTTTLRQKTEELSLSYAELAQVQSELVVKKQLAAVGELAAAIAHEVRNPLAVIVNAVAGLRRGVGSDSDRAMLLDIVEEEAGRLNRLVTDLLRFARPIEVKRAPVSLLELANRCRLSLGETHELQVDTDGSEGSNLVNVDPNLFRIVFDNLVANACEAMRGGGAISIRLGAAELDGAPATRIEIQDRGPGMEPHVLERALDPFFTTRPSGTGLGLPIVHRIVEAHGGELVLGSDGERGTSVVILIPRVQKPEEIKVA